MATIFLVQGAQFTRKWTCEYGEYRGLFKQIHTQLRLNLINPKKGGLLRLVESQDNLESVLSRKKAIILVVKICK